MEIEMETMTETRATQANLKETQPLKVNEYATKKTFAQGLIDVGLLMASASQLKSLIIVGSDGQDFYYVNMVFISLSIVLQVVVGVLLTVIGHSNVDEPLELHRAEKLNNVVVAMIFVITIFNAFIAAFGIERVGETNSVT